MVGSRRLESTSHTHDLHPMGRMPVLSWLVVRRTNCGQGDGLPGYYHSPAKTQERHNIGDEEEGQIG
jgi:hypothetical protein